MAETAFPPLGVKLLGAQVGELIDPGQMIGLLQKAESAHSVASFGRTLQGSHCSLLASDGCTLRLFKSPRCAHFLCHELGADLVAQSGGRAQGFVDAMQRAEGCTISSPADYWSPRVILEADALYGEAD